jgi:S1-C subfamily serine protease
VLHSSKDIVILVKKEMTMTNLLVELSDALADAAKQAGESTVLVNARRRIPASGVAYRKDLILTANHLVERDDDINIALPDGTEIPATVAGRDRGSDLALLKLESAAAAPATAAKSPARVGQIALALGRPSSDGIQASLGVVSAISGPLRTRHGGVIERFIRTDSIPYPGFSGGPLAASDGTVLGINTSGLTRSAAITIPAEIAWKTAETLAEHGHIRRGYLGIRSQLVEIPSKEGEQATGLLVVGVEKDSPAATGGIIVGDILVAVSGAVVSHHDELFALLTGEVVGKSTVIDVLRGGQPQTMNVVIGER